MTANEASVSKSSVSGQSTERYNQAGSQKKNIVDTTFPLYDQIMQVVKLPAWFATLCDMIIAFQILTTGFWVYSDLFLKTSGTYKSIYYWIFMVVSFQDPLEISILHLEMAYICFGVGIASIFWLIIMIYHNNKYFKIPSILLHISVLLLDIVEPVFIMPSAYTAAHGISALFTYNDTRAYIQIALAFIAYIIALTFFMIGTKLKSRSVIITNLTFQSYDSTFINVWFFGTSLLCIIIGITNVISDRYCIFIALIHLGIACFLVFKIQYIPFYNLDENCICFQFGCVSCVLDLNILVHYIAPKITYNYTIYVFLAAFLISKPIGEIIFRRKIKRIQNELSLDTSITDIGEYFTELNIAKNSSRSMSYIVVGLAKMCDYFIDGSLTDYLIQNGDNEATLALLLQIVTYIPSSATKLNMLYKKLVQKRKLSFINRFLVYQITKVKTRRLVTSSKETLEIFNKLEKMNNECMYNFTSFWDKTSCTYDYIERLNYSSEKLNDFFQVSIENNPNNIKIANIYANFLVECRCEFEKAILQMIKIDQIIDGKNFNVDTSFRSFAMRFPQYIKQEIYDIKGNRIIKSNDNDGKGSKSMNPFTVETSCREMPEIVDVESEEKYGKSLIRQSNVRILLNKNLQETKPKQTSMIFILCFTSFCIQIAFMVGFFEYAQDFLSWKKDSYKDIMNLGFSAFYSEYSAFYILLKWAKEHNRYTESTKYLGDISIDNTGYKPLVPINLQFHEAIYYLLDHSHMSLHDLLDSIEANKSTTNYYEVSPELLKTTSTLVECHDGKPGETVHASLKVQLALLTFEENYIAGDYAQDITYPNIFQNDDYGEIMINSHIFFDNGIAVLTHMLDYSVSTENSNELHFRLWMIIGTIVIVVATVAPVVYLVVSFIRMVMKIVNIMLHLSNKVKEEAKNPLSDANPDSSETSSANRMEKSMKAYITIAVALILMIAIVTTYILLCLAARKLNKRTSQLLIWYYYSLNRMLYMNHLGNKAIEGILINDSLPSSFTSVEEIIDRIKIISASLEEVQESMMNGGVNYPKSIGFDEKLDDLQIKNLCTFPGTQNTLHDHYACASANQQITLFMNMLKDIVEDKEGFHGTLKSEWAANMLHILEFHLYPNIVATSDRIQELILEQFQISKISSLLNLVQGVVFACIFLFLPLAYRNLMITNYKVLLVLIQHLHPQAIIDSQELMCFLKDN